MPNSPAVGLDKKLIRIRTGRTPSYSPRQCRCSCAGVRIGHHNRCIASADEVKQYRESKPRLLSKQRCRPVGIGLHIYEWMAYWESWRITRYAGIHQTCYLAKGWKTPATTSTDCFLCTKQPCVGPCHILRTGFAFPYQPSLPIQHRLTVKFGEDLKPLLRTLDLSIPAITSSRHISPPFFGSMQTHNRLLYASCSIPMFHSDATRRRSSN